MPLMQKKPHVGPDVVIEDIGAGCESFQSVVVRDNTALPLQSLQAYMGGAPWTTNEWFSQLTGTANNLKEVDPSIPAVQQQYRCIKDLEIRVQSDLTTGYNQNSALTQVNGQAMIYGLFGPNKFDYFTADAGNQHAGLYMVKNVERLTFHAGSSFKVDYELIGYTDDGGVAQQLYTNLLLKVVRTFVFSKDRFTRNLPPILREEEFKTVENLTEAYSMLLRRYCVDFFNRGHQTFILPGQNAAYYDSLLVQYLLKLVSIEEHPVILNVRQLSTDNEVFLSQPQFWDFFLNKKFDDRLYCNQRMGWADTSVFNNNGWIAGIYFSSVDYTVYPKDPDKTTVNQALLPKPTFDLNNPLPVTNYFGTDAIDIDETYTTDQASFPYIYPVLMDDYYVLSQHFYNDTNQKSVLEILVKDYMNQATINLDMLTRLVTRYRSWGRLEQFYYGPILLTLIREVDRGIYS